jgi:hypothetical protein
MHAKIMTLKIVNRSFGNVAQFIIRNNSNKSGFEDKIKRLNSGNACSHSVQNIFSRHLISKYVKIRIYETIILPVALHGCKTWSLTLMEG